MNITYRDTDSGNSSDFACLAKWYADPAIRHFAVPHSDEESFSSPKTAEELREEALKNSAFAHAVDQMILQDGAPIGHCSILIDPLHRFTKDGKVAWLSLTIGEASCRGKGLGKLVIRHLEELAVKLGASSIEVGVFEFNVASLRLFQSLGYKRIGQLENFTYWNGKRWSDLRFLKPLSA